MRLAPAWRKSAEVARHSGLRARGRFDVLVDDDEPAMILEELSWLVTAGHSGPCG